MKVRYTVKLDTVWKRVSDGFIGINEVEYHTPEKVKADFESRGIDCSYFMKEEEDPFFWVVHKERYESGDDDAPIVKMYESEIIAGKWIQVG